MNEWSAGRRDGINSDRISLDSEESGDLDEALQEAVEAVEAVEAAGRESPESVIGVAPPAVDDEVDPPVDSEAETVGVDAMEALRAEAEELRQRSTRTLADFDNYRKRVEREQETQRRYSGMEVLRGLLDIVDNMERALASDGAVEDLKAGVELTLRQAEVLMRRHGVSRIEADGAVFDPAVHEAVTRLEEGGIEEPTVTAVLQSGYQMHERLLRPVRVAVAMPPAANPPGAEDGEG